MIKKLSIVEKKVATPVKKPIHTPKELIELCNKKYPGLLEALKDA